MNVGQLKKLLANHPDNMECYFDCNSSEFRYGFIDNVKSEIIPLKESPDGKTLAKDKVLVFTQD